MYLPGFKWAKYQEVLLQEMSDQIPTGNIPRVLPEGLEAVVDERRWRRPAIFDWLQRVGNIEREEMHRTFNCGLGMTICVPPAEADRAVALLRRHGADATLVGEVRRGDRGVVIGQ